MPRRKFKKIPIAVRKKLAKKTWKASMRSVLDLPDGAQVPTMFTDEAGRKYYNKPVSSESIQSIKRKHAEEQNIDAR